MGKLFVAVLVLLAWVLGTPLLARAAGPLGATLDAAQIVHLIDYVGGDYGGAVSSGTVVNERELSEQIEVIAEASRIAARLPGHGKSPRDYDVAGAVAKIGQLVRSHAPEAEVVSEVKTARAQIVLDFDLVEAPRALPSRAVGRELYEQHCATCHGSDGRAQTVRAREYTPRPADFLDPQVASSLSPVRIFNTIRFGVPNTAMAPFDFLPEENRWSVAFYVATLDHEPPGEAIAEARFFTLGDLSSRSDGELGEDLRAAGIPEERVPSALADLRTAAPYDPRTAAPASRDASLLRARAGLARVRSLYLRGDREGAKQAIIAMYLDDIEPIEPALRAADPALARRLESRVSEARSLTTRPPDEARWSQSIDALGGDLARAARTLGGGMVGRSTWSVVLTSAGITLREGVEAALLIAALLGVVAQSGAEDKKRWVHVGWLLAVFSGLLTWVAATRLIAISGMGREVIEGGTAIVAASILFYVSYWLFARREAARWIGFLRDRTSRGRAAISIAGIAFLAAYREAFETVIFYSALVSERGAGVPAALGGALGLALLGGLVFAYGRAGKFAPPRWFFGLSSLLLYVLAVIFAGQGIASLQTTGWLPLHPLPRLPHLPILGIYSTLETYVVQIALIAMALLAAAILKKRARAAA